MDFSEELIKETQDCFHDEHGIELSEETANEYLMSLSDLYLAFAKPNKVNADDQVLPSQP